MNTALFINVLAQAAAPEAPKASDSGMYNLFILIVVVACFVAILVAYVRGNKGGDAAQPVAAPAAAATRVAAPVAAQAGTDTALLAVLAAAAYTALGQQARIISIEPVSTEWGVQGRRDIFLSHKVR